LVPNKEEFPRRCVLENWAVKEMWEGQALTEWRCDLAWGILEWYVVRCESLHPHISVIKYCHKSLKFGWKITTFL
jgi:hypothetical protein